MESPYANLSLKELKKLGHILLERYVKLDDKRNRREATEYAYRKLGEKLKTSYRQHHFSEMKSRIQAIRAVARLRKMVAKRKERLEEKSFVAFAPREVVKQELQKLCNQ